jgi:putative hydrolase
MSRATPGMDMNGKIAALLRDFAAIQKSKQSMWGYKRAASAILALEEPIESFLQPDGTLRKIPNIGPSSTRVILEVLQTGSSPTIEKVERRQDLRGHFLSRAQVLAALRNRKLTGPRLEDYHGDLQMHSTWSDGSQSLEDIIDAGIARGYSFSAVTDHSYGLKIAGGVSMAELARSIAARSGCSRGLKRTSARTARSTWSPTSSPSWRSSWRHRIRRCGSRPIKPPGW